MAEARPPAPDQPIVHSSGGERPAYSEDGVDLTLIAWMLSLTPRERLEVAQSAVDAVHRLRHDEAEL